METLYAFWKYDMCPYMIGGVVERICGNGRVIAKGYQGMRFNPIIIMSGDVGMKALENLKKLRRDYSIAEKKLKTEFKNMALKNIGKG